MLLKESQKVVSSLNKKFETLVEKPFRKDFEGEKDRIVKRVLKIVRNLQDKRINKMEKI